MFGKKGLTNNIILYMDVISLNLAQTPPGHKDEVVRFVLVSKVEGQGH